MNDWFMNVRAVLRGRYVRALEEQLVRERADIDRLREENRAMLNSLLGLAGVPPVEVPRVAPAGAPTIRRRSWPQVAATREIEAARNAQSRERL